MNKDKLGDRMKGSYENRTRFYLPRRTYTICRLDGAHFHTYTRGLEKPFDLGLIEDMQLTTIGLCKNISGVICGYTQSDEISLLLTDFEKDETEAYFDGNLQKICSVSASMATGYFNNARTARWLKTVPTEQLKVAFFDSRVFTIPDPTEVENYFLWRQTDATRNAIQMVAQSMYSHKQLHGKGWSDLNEMLFQKGINFNDIDSHLKRGSFISKEYKTGEMVNRKIKDMEQVTRSYWTVMAETPMFTSTEGRKILKDLIPKYQ